MSNFITSNDGKSRIAKLIYREIFFHGDTGKIKLCYNTKLENNALEQFNKYAKNCINIENADTEILKILEDMNNNAVNNRYGEKDKTIHYPMEIIPLDELYIIQTYKSLQCFIYNSDNDITLKKYNHIFKYLNELEHRLGEKILMHSQDYKEAKWQ